MNLLQKLQNKNLSEFDSIIDNLELLCNTYNSSHLNLSYLPFGIDYFKYNIEQIYHEISSHEKRILISNEDIELEGNQMLFEFKYRDIITKFIGGK